MGEVSAGVLMYRVVDGRAQVLLVHPGGPYWRGKDLGSWSIPKGGVNPGEDLLDCARREFEEETGFKAIGELVPLKPIRQKSGKIVHAWAMAGDLNPAEIRSNTFRREWPPKSGRFTDFPEVDGGAFFDLELALRKIHAAQAPFVIELAELLKGQ
jgi:predicted NUDIX family NTP pyrophosphohydrolase